MTQRERRAELDGARPRLWRYVAVGVLAPLLLGVIITWQVLEGHRSNALRIGLAASYERRINAVLLLSDLQAAETAQRGYLLTDSPAYLSPFAPARRSVLARLIPLVSETELPRGERLAIDRLARDKLTELEQTITAMQAGHRDAALRIVEQGRGRRDMEQLRARLSRVMATEAGLTAKRRDSFAAERAALQGRVLVVYSLLIAVLLVALRALWRGRNERYAASVAAFEAAERNQTILNSTVDAILILNPSGTVEVMNAAAAAMLGYSSDELERRDVSTVIDIAPGTGSFPERIGMVGGQLRRAFLPDRKARRRDGRELSVDAALGVMSLPSGDHVVLSLRDIAERKRVERMKDDLISTVSHELRTPLTSIVGALGLLRAAGAGTPGEGSARLVEIAEQNSRRLIRLINDMLDIDRIESGKLSMASEQVDLRHVMDRSLEGAGGIAQAERITLRGARPGAPVMVTGDAERLVQVVSNLLSNAIRFAPGGSEVAAAVRADEDGRALITVDDRGAGVPLAFRDRIFQRFERASKGDGATGTGLGLAISREIVARHGGTIWFEDRPEGGTRFVVALPLSGREASRDGDAPRVLVAEQDEELAALLVATAINEGCVYDTVRDEPSALAAIAERRYAAVLVDLHLPGGGLALARALREADPAFTAPIVVVASPARIDHGPPPMLDIVDCITKPAEAGRLADALRGALGRVSTSRPLILHLDDDRDLLDVVAAALDGEAEVVTVTDLMAARALLDRRTPDLAILDINLADGSGIDLIPFLLDANGLAIPTIAYAAQELSEDAARQFDAVVVKARGSMPDLKATIRRVIRAGAARNTTA